MATVLFFLSKDFEMRYKVYASVIVWGTVTIEAPNKEAAIKKAIEMNDVGVDIGDLTDPEYSSEVELDVEDYEFPDGINKEIVFKSALETLLWSECDADGNPLYKNYEVEDISEETYDKLRKDCDDFVEAHEVMLNESGLSDEKIGHNFVLSRNGHGAGFFDAGCPHADELQKATKLYGTFGLYAADGIFYHG
jgi:hypothetical protein